MSRFAVCLALLLAVPSVAADKLQDVIVKPGDTLWSIANKWLADPAKWDEILAFNRLPTADPTVALPGMTLRVPVRLIKASLRAAHLTYYVNDVRRRPKDEAAWKEVSVGMELRRGDALRTRDDSRARVMLLDKELLSLEPNSMATIKPSDDTELVLGRGTVFAGKARLVLAGAKVTPKSADTRYSATVEPNLTTRVEVYRGTATVAARGVSVDVPAGMETIVLPDSRPEKPRPWSDPVGLEVRAHEYASALTTGGGLAPDPRPAPPPRKPEGDVRAVRGDIQVLRIGQPIKAYHVQASETEDFRKIVFDRVYDEGDRFDAEDIPLKPAAYWWRVAAIDLLGVKGRFKAPHYYSIGLERPDADELALAESLQIISPEENYETGAEVVRASGVLRDDRLRLTINGVPVKIAEDGTFSITVRVNYGRTEITFSLTDPKGNQAHVTRNVLKM